MDTTICVSCLDPNSVHGEVLAHYLVVPGEDFEPVVTSPSFQFCFGLFWGHDQYVLKLSVADWTEL
jgi:hypothetical protein